MSIVNFKIVQYKNRVIYLLSYKIKYFISKIKYSIKLVIENITSL